MAAPEAVTQWGNLNDWHHAIGTGPFILQDYVSGSSVTLVKNTNYWGMMNAIRNIACHTSIRLKYSAIPDMATGLAAVRTGKIMLWRILDCKMPKQCRKPIGIIR